MDGKRETNTCRVCLRLNLRKCKSLFEEFMSSTISLHISSLVQFTISVDDEFPNKICLPCFKQLQNAVEFKHKCESSHATLLSTLTVIKEEDLKEEEWPKTEQLETLKEEDKIEIIKDEWTKIEESEEYLEESNNWNGSDDPESIKAEKTGSASTKELEHRTSRAIDLKLECHDCGEIFKSKCKIKVHWNKVHLPNALVCSVCKKKCGNYRSLNLHRKMKSCVILGKAKIEGQGKNRVFHCKECSYKTKSPDSWLKHEARHRGERAFVCHICNKHYSQYSSLQAHKESIHQLYEAEGTCYICGKFIKGKSQMRHHLRRHRFKSVKCETCGKVLKNKLILANHMASCHSNIKPYTCEICAHTLHTHSSLIHHQRKVHLNIKYWFHCDLCEYKCQGRIPLKQHRDKHTSTNCPCTVCGRFYEGKKQLQKHQLLHFGERNFVCNFCDKAFLTQHTLRNHFTKVHKLKARDPAVQLVKINNKLGRECIEENKMNESGSTENICNTVTESK